MAYGLDFEDIIYAGRDMVDLGVLQTYKISVDLADEKDFEIQSPEPVIPLKGFWYIQGTEYGGIVDGFDTDSDEEKITYKGRTFRGMLASKYVNVQSKSRTIPSVTVLLTGEEEAPTASISDCMRQLVAESDLDVLFTVEEPDIHETVSPMLNSYTIQQGTSLYDALVGMAKSIGFTFVMDFRGDHKVHITPILIQDYVDYLKGSRYDGLGFKTEIDAATTNHLIVSALMEDGNYRVAHFFADENGGIRPYKTVEAPIKDEQYIVDFTSRVMTGIDEVTAYEEVSDSAVENYELLSEVPDDWFINFGAYYRHEFEDEYKRVTAPTGNPHEQGWYEQIRNDYVLTEDTEVVIGKPYYYLEVGESFNEYEAVGEEVYDAVLSQPEDWATNYSSYYIRSWDEDEGDYTYTAVSADSVIDQSSIKQITSIPDDWTSNFDEYYYRFFNGTDWEFRQYDAVTSDNYILMTAEPSDWAENYGSYYRKVVEQQVENTSSKKKKKAKKEKETVLVDTLDAAGAYYTNCTEEDDVKGGTSAPSFAARPHYKQDSYSVPPVFVANNTYRLSRIEVPPTWDAVANRYYSMHMEYHAPTFVIGEAYRQVLDHYQSMAETAIEFFEDEKLKSKQEMEVDDFSVNIGDVIGGVDEFTKTSVVGTVSNIEAEIENGLIDLFYGVTVDSYTTALIKA